MTRRKRRQRIADRITRWLDSVTPDVDAPQHYCDPF